VYAAVAAWFSPIIALTRAQSGELSVPKNLMHEAALVLLFVTPYMIKVFQP
jgi:hypothetical protein